jgi:RNA polymerase sigma factor (sigma-70 family)
MNDDATIAPETRALLEQHHWETTIPRLVKYALDKTRRLYWQGKLGGDLPGGQQAEDLVEEAIEKVRSGERKWNPYDQPDLYEYLRSVIDSLISHLVNSRENRVVIRLVPNDDDKDPINRFPDRAATPLDRLLQEEREASSERWFWGFHSSLADDPPLQRYIECIYEYPTNIKPSAIAEQLGITLAEIYNLKKRLKRRLTKYLAQPRAVPRYKTH